MIFSWLYYTIFFLRDENYDFNFLFHFLSFILNSIHYIHVTMKAL